MTAKRLIIDPVGGLANRLRAVRSAMQLADELSATLELAWGTGRGCNCPFEQLFQVLPGVERSPPFHRPESSHDCLPVFQLAGGFAERAISHCQMDHLVRKKFDFMTLGRHQSVLITTYTHFFGDEYVGQSFVPVQELQALIDQTTRSFGERTVGIHVRRTDNRNSIKRSPTALFKQLMQREIAEHNDTRFFLATDDPIELRALSNVFGDRIITFPSQSLDRNDPQAIRDAVVDLYSLSRCCKVIGSFGSSFTRAAGSIGGIPLSIAFEPE